MKQTETTAQKAMQLISAVLLLAAIMLARLLLAAVQKAVKALRKAAEKRFARTTAITNAAEKEEK